MINRCIIGGRLTKSPELKTVSSGTPIARFSIASNRPFKNDKGEYEADFINCVAWRKTAELIAEHFGKGDLIIAHGRWTVGSYVNDQNEKRQTNELTVDSFDFVPANKGKNDKSDDDDEEDEPKSRKKPTKKADDDDEEEEDSGRKTRGGFRRNR